MPGTPSPAWREGDTPGTPDPGQGPQPAPSCRIITWANRTMKRLLGSLAWYWASCRSIAASRALLVPEEEGVQAESRVRGSGLPPSPRHEAQTGLSPRLTAAHHAHGKDGVIGDLGVSIVGELAEGVKDVEPGVGDRDKCQGQGHSTAEGRLPIPQLHRAEVGVRHSLPRAVRSREMRGKTQSLFPGLFPALRCPPPHPSVTHQVAKCAQGHLSADLLTHGNERNPQHCYALRGHGH